MHLLKECTKQGLVCILYVFILLVIACCAVNYSIGRSLMTTKYFNKTLNNPNKNCVILLWGKTYLEGLTGVYNCKQYTSRVTSDRRMLKKSHVVMLNSRFISRPQKLPPEKYRRQMWAIASLESPSYDRFPTFLNKRIDMVATYHRSADIPLRYGYFGRRKKVLTLEPFSHHMNISQCSPNLLPVPLLQGKSYKIWISEQKSKLVLWYVSHCSSKVCIIYVPYFQKS